MPVPKVVAEPGVRRICPFTDLPIWWYRPVSVPFPRTGWVPTGGPGRGVGRPSRLVCRELGVGGGDSGEVRIGASGVELRDCPGDGVSPEVNGLAGQRLRALSRWRNLRPCRPR